MTKSGLSDVPFFGGTGLCKEHGVVAKLCPYCKIDALEYEIEELKRYNTELDRMSYTNGECYNSMYLKYQITMGALYKIKVLHGNDAISSIVDDAIEKVSEL